MKSASTPTLPNPKATLPGLVVATHTPMRPDGSLNLEAVEPLAAHLERNRLAGVFIAGTTGEGHLLTIAERKALALRWAEVLRGSALKLIVHVGHNCLAEARDLATHAAQVRAFAVAALAPSYFKPANLDRLIDSCAEIAAAAPELPFYYYDIPSWTGVFLSMPDFLARGGERIPNLAGIKFSNSDLAQFQHCLHVAHGAFEVFFGIDEYLLASLVLGGTAAVGSTYSFAAPLFHRLINAFHQGDLRTARDEQFRALQLIGVLAARSYLPSAKTLMRWIGVDVGPARLPQPNLTEQQSRDLRHELEAIGFFDWL